MKELSDYSMLLEFVPIVYMEVTGGRISKPNTLPFEIISEFENVIGERIDEYIEDLR